ncbi:MAG: DNRLRE domain-containing protein [Planctomycetes bacterium]|nr:DNRLRE domain-containing protein [Planctomycetota bacterium]
MRRLCGLAAVLGIFWAAPGSAGIVHGPYLQPTDDMETSVGIMWTCSGSSGGTVKYGISSVNENTATTAAGTTHYRKLTGLTAGTTYKYQVICDGTTTPEYAFRTSSATQERRIIVLSDVHAQPGGWQTQQAHMLPDMLAFDPDVVVMAGDNVQLGDVLADYDAMFETYRELFATAITAPAAGNHEWNYDTGLVIYAGMWSLPENCAAAPEKNYYFDYGGIRWVMVSNVDYAGNETWVQNALTSGASFRVATTHYPIYLSCEFDDEMAGNISDEGWKVTMRSTFEATGTDLHLAGHRHLYHRTFPVLSTETSPACVPAIGSGWGGPETSETTNYTDPLGTIYFELSSMYFEESGAIYQRPFFAAVGPELGDGGKDWVGYSTIVVNTNVLTYDNYVYSRDGTIKKDLVDHFVLDKSGLASISGTVTEGGAPLAAVKVSVDGSHFGYTNASGNYTIPGLSDGSYTVTPTKLGYTFTPASTGVAISGGDQTGVNFTASASGGTIVLQKGLDGYTEVKDNMLRSDSPDGQYGDHEEIRTVMSGGSPNRVAIIEYDLSMIASGAVVSSATLQIYLMNKAGAGNLHIGTLGCYWEEMSSTWNQPRDSYTWPGGNAVAASTEFGSIPQPGSGWVSFTVTSAVQAWVDGTTNNGFCIWGDDTIDNRYWSSDYAADASLRPKLTVTYAGAAPDTTAPSITASSAVLSGTVTDDSGPVPSVTVGGTTVSVTAGAWTSPATALAGNPATVPVTAEDASGNIRTVNVTFAH